VIFVIAVYRLRSLPSGYSLLKRFEGTEIHSSALEIYAGTVTLQTVNPEDSMAPVAIPLVESLIHVVTARRDAAEIVDPVITASAVNVVQRTIRPSPAVKPPNNPVRKKRALGDLQNCVTPSIQFIGSAPGPSSVKKSRLPQRDGFSEQVHTAMPRSPKQRARLRTPIEKGAQIRRAY
jgi:hypothetical protein